MIEEEHVLQAKLDFLHEQLRAGGLKDPYYPRTAPPTANGLLQLQQNLNTLLPSSTVFPGVNP